MEGEGVLCMLRSRRIFVMNSKFTHMSLSRLKSPEIQKGKQCRALESAPPTGGGEGGSLDF